MRRRDFIKGITASVPWPLAARAAVEYCQSRLALAWSRSACFACESKRQAAAAAVIFGQRTLSNVEQL